jgi:dienelactone hydrolase
LPARTWLAAALFVPSVVAAGSAAAQTRELQIREPFPITSRWRGQPLSMTATLVLPSGSAKVPVMVLHHGSSGVTEAREFRYAGELAAMGVAALVIDSFKPRNVTSTVRDQTAVTGINMIDDGAAALRAVATHPRLDARRTGIAGFSKGGTSAWQLALETVVAERLPAGLRYRLHVPFYPACTAQYRIRPTGAAIYPLLGARDTYVGIEPCLAYAAKFRAAGAPIETRVYPHAGHGFDGLRPFMDTQGENYSACVFEQQADGTWKDQKTGTTVLDRNLAQIPDAYGKAMSACRTLGVSGGPDEAARQQSLADLKSYVRRHLLDGR